MMSVPTLKTMRTKKGIVVSVKMQKSIVVRIDRRVEHPLYGKVIKKSTRLTVHDEAGQCKEGDVVLIKECRPLSKTKSWTLVEVLESAAVKQV